MFQAGTKRPSKVMQTKVSVRVSTKTLIQAVDCLTEEQRRWVKDAGFGHLLDFSITMYPNEVACKLLWTVDTNELALKLEDKIIHISDADVERVLGFPRGERAVTLTNDATVVRSWYNDFTGLLPSRIKNSDILDKIKAEQTASAHFKRNFLILVANTLISPTKDANANKELAFFSGDWDRLSEYNWCEYVIANLKRSIETWKSDTTRDFTGPLLFIVLLYFDRIKNTVYPPRTMPTFKAWNDSLLRDRQYQEINSIDFGSGELMPVIADQDTARTDSQEGDEAYNHNANEERDEENKDDVVSSNSKRRAEKGKAPASQSSTESGDSVLEEVTSTIDEW